MKIKKILIANRGEIALRVMRTAKLMGYPVVALFSDQDINAAHVYDADEKFYLQGNTLADTYLNIPAIINAAKSTGANAIHPGYGFLSENPLFAEACENEEIIFIGPSSSAIKAMGNKIRAREIAIKHGIPVTPGLTGLPEELLANHSQIGFPILIKAAAGGGGKGMRIVNSLDEMEAALLSTSSEAGNYFGDRTVYIERFFENPRHIEVQIIGDKHGNIIHLYERECSMQRRHQKIIEEAPSVSLTPEIQKSICAAAVEMAASINYYSAGTIEFLVDKDLNFYFLEMNTRIQVEHPVTEMITGVDIVREQLRIAEGEKLTMSQDQIAINGHAIETRIYAEDPSKNFMPSPGKISHYSYPEASNVRVDDPKLNNNSEIFSNFDPMIAKAIAWSNNRNGAIDNLKSFLPHYAITGIKTNIQFLLTLLDNSDFRKNEIHTRYIDNNLNSLNEHTASLKSSLNIEIPLLGGIIFSLGFNNNSFINSNNIWQTIGYWRIYSKISLVIDDQEIEIILKGRQDDHFIFEVNNKTYTASLKLKSQGSFILTIDEIEHQLYISGNHRRTYIIYEGFTFELIRQDVAPDDSETLSAVNLLNSDSGDLMSPMPGRVLTVKVKAGERVKKGQLLMVIEAMKMENNILAPADGVIDKILVNEGDNVDNSTHLVHLLKADKEVTTDVL